MDKSQFALFFSLPLEAVDFSNLAASKVRTVMLPLVFADTATLDRLHSMGVRVVLRTDEDYYDDVAPLRIRNQVQAASNHAAVLAVIVGVEPENGAQFGYDAPTWSQDRAYEHRRRFDAVRMALQAAGFAVVSPGWTMRSISEDEAPQPGKVAWREIVTLPQMNGSITSRGYADAQGNATHIYCYGWEGYVDEMRLKFALKEAAMLWHKPLWIDEVGISGKSTQMEKMRAYIDIAQMLITKPIGKRVALLCPFVSNGDPGLPPSWDQRFVIRDPACYVELGKWMTS